MCAPEAKLLIEREKAAFETLYPEAHIDLSFGRSRQAVAALFAARSDLAVIARELSTEERGAAVRGRLELEGYRFARDAVVVLVHPSNLVENMAVETLRRIYLGEAQRWSELGGAAAPIEPVVQPPDSDIMECFVQQVMDGQAVSARALYAANDSSVAAVVAARPNAVGFVSLAWADRGARAVRLASVTGLTYLKPDLEEVYRGEYPLTRFFNFYMRPAGPPLASGFITFVTSRDGQKIVHETGLVPTTVPVRFVRRSPMQSTH